MPAVISPIVFCLLLAWTTLAVAPGASEPLKLTGLAAAAGLLALRLPFAGIARSARNALLAYAFAFVLATLLALEPEVAFFGSRARGQGSLAALSLVVIAATAAALDLRACERIYVTAGVLASLVAAYGLVQWLGFDRWNWAQSIPGRPAATLSNPSTLAGFLGLSLPLTLYLAWSRPHQCGLWLAAVALQSAAVVATATRSVLIGLTLSALLLGFARPSLRRWRLPVAVMIVLLSGTLAVQRLESLDDRSNLWQAAAHVITDPPGLVDVHGVVDPLRRWRPVMGFGPDLQQAPLRTKLSGMRSDVAAWQADRAHQIALDRTLETGCLGLATGLALCLLVAMTLLQRLRGVSPALNGEVLALTCALGIWFLHLQLSFALTGDRSLAWILIGFALAAGGRGDNPTPAPRMAKIWPVLLALGLFAGAAISVRGGRAGAAERLFTQGQQRYAQAMASEPAVAQTNLIEAARRFERAAWIRPHDSDAALAAASAWVEAAAIARTPALIEKAQHWLDKAAAMDPRDPRLQPVAERIGEVRGPPS